MAETKADPKKQSTPKFLFASRVQRLRVNIVKPEVIVDLKGNRRIEKEGKSVQFENGQFATDDASIANALRKRAEEFPACGFHEIDTSKVAEAVVNAA